MSDSICAALIAQTLRSGGVRYVFGHPGGEVLELMDAVASRGIEFVLTGHESGLLAPDPGGLALWTVPGYAALLDLAREQKVVNQPVELVGAGLYADIGREVL